MVNYRIATKEDLKYLAELRIKVFYDFPYLYEGNLDYEEEYLKTYAQNSLARIFLSIVNHQGAEKIVGASSCIPLEFESANVQEPFIEQNFNPSDFLYFGESVLLSDYRGLGIGVKFFKLREEYALSLGKKYTTFCGVLRSDNHPLRPESFKNLDSFWHNRGYQKASELVCEMSWKDRDQKTETKKQLQFWIKKLR